MPVFNPLDKFNLPIVGFYTDFSATARMQKINDRIMLGRAIDYDGTTNTTGFTNTYADTAGVGYLVWGGQLISLSSVGGSGATFGTRASDSYNFRGDTVTLWTSGGTATLNAKIAILGQVYTVTVAGTFGASAPVHTAGSAANGTATLRWEYTTQTVPLGFSSFVLADYDDGRGAWASYIEAVKASTGGTTFGIELVSKNKGNNAISHPYSLLPAGTTVNLWLVGGGDASTGAPTNPSTAGIEFVKSGHTFNKGIVFGNDSLTGADGTTGYGTAIAMAKGHIIGWYNSSGVACYEIVNDITTAANKQTLYGNDTLGTSFLNASGVTLFRIGTTTGSVTGNLAIDASLSAAPILKAEGSATNIDINIVPKGTGVIKVNGTALLDTDGTLAANSDAVAASQKATKTYADTKVPNTRTVNGSALSSNVSLAGAKAAFSAHKNGTTQTVSSATGTKLTATTEAYDVGSYYDAANSKWTPPAGAVLITARVYITAGVVDQAQLSFFISKNGSTLGTNTVRASGGFDAHAQIVIMDVANGTDYYEYFMYMDGAGNKTVDGGSGNTMFQGVLLQ